MGEFDHLIEDRPERLEDETANSSDPFGFSEGRRGIGLSLGLLVFLLPVGLFVGAMRWNIADTLDTDLQWVFTKFCDTVLLFFIALPICPPLPGEWGSKLSRRVFKGLMRLLWVAKWMGILVFAAAGLASVGYCLRMIWKLIAG